MPTLLVKIDVDDKATPRIAAFETLTKQTNKSVASLGQTLNLTFAATAAYKGLNAIINSLKMCTDETLKFEKAIVSMGAITNTSSEGMAKYSKQAIELSKTTEFSASAIAGAMLEMSKAGMSADQIWKMLPNTLNVATAAGEDLLYTTKGMINTMMSYGIGFEESERVANVYTRTLNASKLSLESYMEAMKYVASVADPLNTNLEETSALLALLSQRGIEGSLAGTSLRNMMLNMLAPTSKAAKALEGMNFEGLTLTQVLGQMEGAGIKVEELLALVDKRAINSALAISKNTDEVGKFMDIINGSGMTAKEQAELIRKSFTDQLAMVKNSFQALGISIFEAFGTEKQTAIESLKGYVESFGKYIIANKVSIQKFFTDLVTAFKLMAETALPVLEYMAAHLKEVAVVVGLLATGSFVNWLSLSAVGIANFAKAIVAAKVVIGLTAPEIILVTALLVALAAEYIKVKKAIDQTIESQQKFNDGYNNLEHAAAYEKVAKLKKALEEEKKALDAMRSDNTSLVSLAASLDAFGKKERAYREHLKELDKIKKDWKKKSGGEFPDVSADGLQGMADYIREKLRPSIAALEPYPSVSPIIDSEVGKRYSDMMAKRKEAADKELVKIAKERESLKKASIELDKLENDLMEQNYAIHLKILAVQKEDTEELLAQYEIYKELQKTYEEIANTSSNTVVGPLRVNSKYAGAQGAFESDKDFTKRLALWKKDQADFDKIWQKETEKYKNATDNTIALTENTANTVMNIQEIQHNETMKRIYDEQSAIEKRYNAESIAAGSNAIKKAMAEEKFQRAQEALRQKTEKENTAFAKKQQRIAGIMAHINAVRMSMDAFLATDGPIYAKIAAAISAGAMGTTQALVIQSQNFRHGGFPEGNSTSDSNLAYVSKGERVLAESEINAIGGNERLNQMIDRGNTYTTSSSVVVRIDNFVGTREQARELLPYIKKELSR
jgi:TP901 family phage tail tape measure protein